MRCPYEQQERLRGISSKKQLAKTKLHQSQLHERIDHPSGDRERLGALL